MPDTQHWVLTLTCPDRPGIVHAITGAIVRGAGNITELKQFTSLDTGRFFTRIQFETEASEQRLRAALDPVAADVGGRYRLYEAERRMRTLVLVSKAGHCLNDILFRQRAGLLPIEIPLIMSNHPDLSDLAGFYGVPFERHEVTAETKQRFEAALLDHVRDLGIELVVLARYMQILSPGACEALTGRVINIHHSFLPGFKGANPYRQAHRRGVKIVGATAHFVTADLDEGPIIEQNVVRVNHEMTVRQLVDAGQRQESATLSGAMQLFAEHRVLLDGARTIIFD
ncbi:formyltetrahydrofolate deformylase [Propionicicella superfundia]|uniref:formyltetrahydrofolate deformylase n=1 Tax=Propionicicella superfundia TaxID=348582 RepID=UPI00040473FF|nr:formyltetrahydrofolate deformylase [Propionicicella superfundia]